MKKILEKSLVGTIEVKRSDGFQCLVAIENGELQEHDIENPDTKESKKIYVITGNDIRSTKKLRKGLLAPMLVLAMFSRLKLQNESGFHIKKEICIWGINNGIYFSDREQTVKLYKKWNLDVEYTM